MSMKNDIQLVRIAISIAIISLLLVPSFNKPVDSQSDSSFLNYVNPDYSIKMQYPVNWEVVETDLHPNEAVRFRINSAAVQVFVTPTTIDNIVDLANASRDIITENSEKRLISSSTDVKFAGLPSYQDISYDYSAGKSVKVLSILTLKEGDIFEMMYITEPGLFDEYLPQVSKMIDSFEITK